MKNIETYHEGDLTIQVEKSDHVITISWLGKCTLKNPSLFLDPILSELYMKSYSEIKRMICDFTKFSFMNSSAIIPVIKILKMARDGRGSVHVIYNKNERWQEILLGELKIFETDDNRVQIKGVAL
ncbi:MAG: hypothetical protein OEV66_05400 [Spirochaetia bacterium]|nr:hypothetical protein [Spirochaetia bacterium]